MGRWPGEFYLFHFLFGVTRWGHLPLVLVAVGRPVRPSVRTALLRRPSAIELNVAKRASVMFHRNRRNEDRTAALTMPGRREGCHHAAEPPKQNMSDAVKGPYGKMTKWIQRAPPMPPTPPPPPLPPKRNYYRQRDPN